MLSCVITLHQVTKEFVPAPIFLATDHLVSMLLLNGYIRRDLKKDETNTERFAKVGERVGHIAFVPPCIQGNPEEEEED